MSYFFLSWQNEERRGKRKGQRKINLKKINLKKKEKDRESRKREEMRGACGELSGTTIYASIGKRISYIKIFPSLY